MAQPAVVVAFRVLTLWRAGARGIEMNEHETEMQVRAAVGL